MQQQIDLSPILGDSDLRLDLLLARLMNARDLEQTRLAFRDRGQSFALGERLLEQSTTFVIGDLAHQIDAILLGDDLGVG